MSRGVYFHQNADGSWDLTKAVAAACGVSLSSLRRKARRSGHPEGNRLLATLLVLALTEKEGEGERMAMATMIEKARDWVRDAIGDRAAPEGSATWEDWAAKLL